MNKAVILLALSICTLIGCTDSKQINANNVRSVTDFDYTMNNKQAVSITFGETSTNYCDATIYRDSVKSGYSAISNQKSVTDLSMDCSWGGKNYMQSSKHPTSTNIKIVSLDSASKTATINVSLNLVNPSSDEYFSLKDVSLVLKNEQFDNLVKKI